MPAVIRALTVAAAIATLLPANAVLDLRTVRSYFTQVTNAVKSGADETAQGRPEATRAVFYENASNSKRVTITVDQYANGNDAGAAFQTALAKSELPGSKPLHVPELGDRTFAGLVTMNGETHAGIGVLSGRLVIGVTLAGFSANAETIATLVEMTRAQVAHLR